jgi:hypothetical protein
MRRQLHFGPSAYCGQVPLKGILDALIRSQEHDLAQRVVPVWWLTRSWAESRQLVRLRSMRPVRHAISAASASRKSRIDDRDLLDVRGH